MAYADVMPVPFEIGRVIRRMTESIGRRWRLLAVVVLLFSILPGAALILLIAGIDAAAGVVPFARGGLLVALAALLIAGILAQATAIKIFLADQADGTVTLRDSLSAALAALLPTIGLRVVVWVVLAIAWIFFVVPALILLTRWLVALPALIGEREGILASLDRSRGLTDGARWPIFGLILVTGLIYILMIVLATGLLNMADTLGLVSVIVGVIAQQIVLGSAAIVWAGMLASTYVELREVKEGAPTNQMAEVFA